MLKVDVLAFTQFAPQALDENRRILGMLDEDRASVSDIDSLHEFAGRECYQSWSRPNPETATNKTYLEKSIVANGHFSVLEHGSVSLRVTGVSRSLLTELTRHRHLSFSVLSQRYVNQAQVSYVVPPAVRDMVRQETGDTEETIESNFREADFFSIIEQEYEDIADSLADRGLSRKKALEAARAVLPNCTATQFVVTGNIRAWREIIAKRDSPFADAEIQEFAALVRERLISVAPNSMIGA